MKLAKLFLAAAAAAAASAPAAAASVTVYGVIDLGVGVAHTSGSNADGSRVDSSTATTLNSGMRNSSRIGFKGTEEIGDYKVGFILENQFKADDGTLQTSGTLWEREASLSVAGPFGKVSAGHLGLLKGVVGSTSLMNSYRVNPFGSNLSKFAGGYKAYTTGTAWYADNAIVYSTPKMGGLDLHFQYSNAYSGQEGATYNKKARYFAAAARYMSGPLFLQAIADTTNLGSEAGGASRAQTDRVSRDPMSLNVSAAYDFGVVKPYLIAEVFKDSTLNTVGSWIAAKSGKGYDGAGGTFVLQFPAFGGKAKIGGGFMKAELSESTPDLKKSDIRRWGVSAGFDYVLTKRTHLYTNAGYVDQKEEVTNGTNRRHGAEFVLGTVHYF
ncbi:porin [Mesosutterella sp. AGMB02718]|uniref:Porin n=1 Tax=Mesosutterella faecium TaxID=2925194 RepID=A0ABT7IPM4_9BURK|nr:porin [Mesosutterella sp. AGMB02718]MDL2059925.1 porin [Mesosutterella sp. AGMB02718]